MPQFIACSFGRGGRTYTYRNEGAPVAVGDVVKVPAARNPEGWQRAIVEAIDVPEPSFETKPLVGFLETAAERAARKAQAEGASA